MLVYCHIWTQSNTHAHIHPIYLPGQQGENSLIYLIIKNGNSIVSKYLTTHILSCIYCWCRKWKAITQTHTEARQIQPNNLLSHSFKLSVAQALTFLLMPFLLFVQFIAWCFGTYSRNSSKLFCPCCSFIVVCGVRVKCALWLALLSADTHFEYYGSFQMSVCHISVIYTLSHTHTHSLTHHHHHHRYKQESFQAVCIEIATRSQTSSLIESKRGLTANNRLQKD